MIRSIHAFDPMTAPATISLWPFRYFVQLWSTRSKPRSRGRKLTGVANVLSINETRPWDAREIDDAVEIGHPHQRIGDRFDVDRARVRAQQTRPRGGIIGVDEINDDAQMLQLGGQEIMSAAVQAVLRKQAIARAEHRSRASSKSPPSRWRSQQLLLRFPAPPASRVEPSASACC